MKKTAGFLGVVVLVSLTGCATHGYVRSQICPLEERLGKLETKVSQPVVMPEADKAAIMQANDKAQAALDVANKVAGDVMQAQTAAKGAEAAAKGAEAAAKGAELAAREAQQMQKKSEKIFELGQKK